MLSSAGEDLRKSLEDANVNLLSLDVSTSGEQQRAVRRVHPTASVRTTGRAAGPAPP